MENRSFDHIFGWLKSTRPNIDSLNGNDAFFIDSDPGHSFQAIREQISGSNESPENPAPTNRFAQQAESMGEGMARTVMSRFKLEVFPVYTGLANEFAVFDQWFASVPATQPNRFYVHSVTSHGAMSNVRKDLIHGFPQTFISRQETWHFYLGEPITVVELGEDGKVKVNLPRTRFGSGSATFSSFLLGFCAFFLSHPLICSSYHRRGLLRLDQ